MRNGFTNMEIVIIASLIAGLIFGSKLLGEKARAYFEIIYRTLGAS